MRTIKINIADRGHPTLNTDTGRTESSIAGHMWLTLPDGSSTGYNRSGITENDFITYKPGYYTKEIVITEYEYNNLINFINNAKDYGFGVNDYNFITNSCVDYTWSALAHMGVNPGNIEGEALPSINISLIGQIFKSPVFTGNDGQYHQEGYFENQVDPSLVNALLNSDANLFNEIEWDIKKIEEELKHNTDKIKEKFLQSSDELNNDSSWNEQEWRDRYSNDDHLGTSDYGYLDVYQEDATSDDGFLPIVMDIDGDGVELTSLDNSSAFYDIYGDDYQYRMGWVAADDGLLAIDIEGDGVISQAREISFIGYLDGAETDLEGLKYFDSNKDNYLDNHDNYWNQFGVWQDKNQNGSCDNGEFKTLANMGITSINLTSDKKQEHILSNTIYGYGEYIINGETQTFADVAFRTDSNGFKSNADGSFSMQTRLEENYWIDNKGHAIAFNHEWQDHNKFNGYFGLDGDDWLFLYQATNPLLLDGGEGSDIITGGENDDIIIGGKGADILHGGKGGNDLLFFDKHDIGDNELVGVDGGDGYDTAILTSLDYEGIKLCLVEDETLRAPYEYITLARVEAVYTQAGDDVINAEHTTTGVKIFSGEGHDVLYGGSGHDSLIAGIGDDHLLGGRGNDSLFGGTGADWYYWNLGDGNDHIGDSELNDLVLLGQGITQNVIEWINIDDDLVIQINQNEIVQSLTMNDWFISQDNRPSLYLHDYGDNYLLLDMSSVELVFNGTESNNILYGDRSNDSLHGYGGDDWLYGYSGKDFLKGHEGTDFLDGGAGDDSLNGDEGDDLIYGNNGVDELEGGAGNDILIFDKDDINISGGLGNDTGIFLSSNNGYVNINLFNWVSSIEFLYINTPVTFDFNSAGQTHSFDLLTGNGNVIITASGILDDLVIYTGIGNDYITGGEGSDSLLGYEGNDTIKGGNNDDFIYGQDGKDFLEGETGADYLDGGNDNDTIQGNEGSDFLYGGIGADILEGGAENDILVWDKEDTIISGGTGDDIGIFTSLDNRDVTIHLSEMVDGIETMYINTQLMALFDAADKTYGIDINTGTGNVDINASDYSQGISIYTGIGNDTLIGSDGNDFLYGGQGRDTLQGGMGNDTYFWDIGDDDDHIICFDNIYTAYQDSILLGAGIATDAIILEADHQNLLIKVISENNTQTLTVHDWFLYDVQYRPYLCFEENNNGNNEVTYQVLSTSKKTSSPFTETQDNDLIHASENDSGLIRSNRTLQESYSLANYTDFTIEGTHLNDLLYGDNGHDTLIGGTGVDILRGGKGNDTYLYSSGDGKDTIIDADGENKLVLKNINANDTSVTRDNDNAVITMADSQTIIIQDQFSPSIDIDTTVLFDDGKQWTDKDLAHQAGMLTPDTNRYNWIEEIAIFFNKTFYDNYYGNSKKLTLNKSITGQIQYSNDKDWFRIDLNKDEQITIDLQGLSLLDPELIGVYDRNGDLIDGTSNDDIGYDAGLLDSQVTFTPIDDGTYYIAVGSSYQAYRGSYALSVELSDDLVFPPF